LCRWPILVNHVCVIRLWRADILAACSGFLKKLVGENSCQDCEFADLARLFNAVDAYCARHFPKEHRGGWLAR
jgi:hypothetical protein